MMAYDYKKEYKDLYLPKTKPGFIKVPRMVFVMVDGQGNPNLSPAYHEAMEILYGISYGIKMTKMTGCTPPGYFDYVVPPLEGLWWLNGHTAPDMRSLDKNQLYWTSLIRQPDFVTQSVFETAKAGLQKKKAHIDLSHTRLQVWEEGLCAQIMHIGPYDLEEQTIDKLEAYIEENGYKTDFSEQRKHHEIYLGDPRKTDPAKLKTVIRLPVKPT